MREASTDSLGHALAAAFASECGSQNKAAELLGYDSGSYSRICQRKAAPTFEIAKRFRPAGIWVDSWVEPPPADEAALQKAVRKMKRLRDRTLVDPPHLKSTGT